MATSDPRAQAGLGLHLEAPSYSRRPLSGSSIATLSSNATMKEKSRGEPLHGASSLHLRNAQASNIMRAENRRDVRTLPSWIDSFEEGDDILSLPTSSGRLLPSPPQAHPARHQHTPTTPARRVSQDGYVDMWDDTENEKKPEPGFFGHREPVKGRKWDHAREGDPVIMQSSALLTSSPWRTYLKSSTYGHAIAEDAKQVDQTFLQDQTPGYERPWRGDLEGGEDSEKLSSLLHSKKKRRTLLRRCQHTLLMHPYVPLIFRLVVLTTSTIALGIAGSIYHLSDKYNYPQTPSSTMAIVVDVVSIPYILYITWDEYTGKPLGLRSPKAKIRLVLLDLVFIIFESSNLTLAFFSLTDDNGSCQTGLNGYNGTICHRVNTLCGILMIALIAWSLTFSVSIFRLVERVGGREEA